MPAKKKLTLSVDPEVIDRAHRYSRAHGTSISSLVTTFLSQLEIDRNPSMSPLVTRIRGVLPAEVSIEDHRRHLAEKQGE